MIETLQQEIQMEAERLVAHPGLPSLTYQGYQTFFETGNRSRFETRYFERRRQLVTLALAYLDARKPSFKEALENLIWEICNEYSWSLPAHFEEEAGGFVVESDVNIDLFAAETGQALGEICELLINELAPAVIRRVEVEVDRRLFQPLLAREWRWEQMANNWSAVVAGSIGLAALSLLPKKAKQQQLITRLEPVFQVYLSSFEADGACLEGVGYWAYGFGYYLYFAEKYRQVYDSDRYLRGQKLQAIAAFPYRSLINQQQFVPFSDANNVDLPTGLLSYCQSQFGVPVPNFQVANSLSFDHCYRWAHLYRNLRWTTAVNQEPVDGTTTYFSDAGWVIYRGEADEFVFAAKAGGNDESHNHNDVGHFIIGSQSLWLTDLGAGEYTKDYFDDDKRYGLLPNRSLGHSVPVINGYEQRYGDYHAKDVVYCETTTGFEFSLDLTELYPEEAMLERYQRRFKVEFAEKSVTVRDEMVFKKAVNRIKQNFISEIKPVCEQEGVFWQSQECLWLQAEGHMSCHEETYQSHQGQEQKAYLLQIEQDGQEDYRQDMVFRKKLK